MMPDGSGWSVGESWQERVWRESDGGRFPACRVPSERGRVLLTRELVDASRTAALSELVELMERG